MNFLITMSGFEKLAQVGTNLQQKKNDELAEMKDDPNVAFYQKLRSRYDRGLVLREFQEYVLLLINEYHRIMDDDELIESIADGSIDPDLDAVIKTIAQIEETESWAHVISLVPIDFKGAVAVILTKKQK